MAPSLNCREAQISESGFLGEGGGWEWRGVGRWGRPICRRDGWSIISEREAPEGTDEEAEGRDELSIGKVNFKSTVSIPGRKREGGKMAQRQKKFLHPSNPIYSPIGQV